MLLRAPCSTSFVKKQTNNSYNTVNNIHNLWIFIYLLLLSIILLLSIKVKILLF